MDAAASGGLGANGTLLRLRQEAAMASTAEQMRAYRGPAVLSFGFRPFFLAGAAWAAVAVALWLPMLAGRLVLPTAFAPLEWHVHELVYGYVPAVVAGFLLTAVPNWTGRLPVVGWPLLGLFAAWAAGRVAVLVSGLIGAGPAAALDLLFLALLAGVVGREIAAAGNTRNLKVLAVLGVLFAGNAVFHAEAAWGGGGGFGMRAGIGATVLLVTLIAGRIVPSFTRNWLARQAPGRLPAPHGRLDAAAMVAGGAALALWTGWPEGAATAGLAAVAAGLHALRLARWAGERTAAEPLVLVLHAAYGFVPAGFALVALGALRPDIVAPSGALHGWTAGAIGLMTLAVMTRASLGHAGQALRAGRAEQAIYLACAVAALARIAAAFGLWREPMLHLSAAAWVAAFGGFVLAYAPLLLRPRAKG
jgi:uncharacterized protein involved in response to NO